MILTFGKYKGTDIKNLPIEYLEWGAKRLEIPKWQKAFEGEIERRRDESKRRDQEIMKNIDSPETWDLLIKESENELWDPFDPDGCYITQKDVDALANKKLTRYKKKIELNNLDNEFTEKWNLSQVQLGKIQSEIELNRRMFLSEEKYLDSVAYIEKRNDLIWEIEGF
jgi:hypothetical protein